MPSFDNENQAENHGVHRMAEPDDCAVCNEPTYWKDDQMGLPVCSTECHDEIWKGFLTAHSR